MNPIQKWKNQQDRSFLYRAIKIDQEESYWSEYAVNYDMRRHQGKSIEAELNIVLGLLSNEMSVLEIGAGTGIFTRHISRKVKTVTVIEPSPSMIRVMKQALEQDGIFNVKIIQSKWEDAYVETHDVVLAAGCLYAFYDIDEALEKMIQKASKKIILSHGINGFGSCYKEAAKLLDVEPPVAGPDYVALYNVLSSMGIYANVSILRSEGEILYDDMDHAVNTFAERMELQNDQIPALREYLQNRIRVTKSGKLSCGTVERISSIIWYDCQSQP